MTIVGYLMTIVKKIIIDLLKFKKSNTTWNEILNNFPFKENVHGKIKPYFSPIVYFNGFMVLLA